MSLDVWSDKRTGFVGRVAGNAVLSHLQAHDGLPVVHEKGTIFATEKRIYVGRVCHAEYLQRGVLQFCNLSTQQHDLVASSPREAFYLFITVSLPVVKFWLVPSNIVGKVLPTLTPKPDKRTRFLRITGKDDKHYLGQFDITQYFHELRLGEDELSRISDAQSSSPVFEKQLDGTVHVSMTLEGTDFRGVLTPA